MSKDMCGKKVTLNIQPELDFTSELFDPVKVLSSKNVDLPFPKAYTFNNIAEFHSQKFLKKPVNDRVKEIPQERNYAWYYSTIGFDPSRGHEFYVEMNKVNKRKRRKGKKPTSTFIIPCENMRSKKIIKIKTKYKLYCQRKFPKWFKAVSYSNKNKNSAYVSQLPTEKMNTNNNNGTLTIASTYANELINNNVQVSSPEDNAEQVLLKPNFEKRSVLSKFNKESDPLSFLKCILFGEVDPMTQHQLSSEIKNENIPQDCYKHTSETVNPLTETLNTNESSKSCNDHVKNSDSGIFLCENAANRNDNSVSDTSGYITDASETDKGFEESKGLIALKNCVNVAQPKVASSTRKLIEKSSKTLKQRSVSNKKVLKSSENILHNSMNTKGKSKIFTDDSKKLDGGDTKKQPIIVSINRELIKIRSIKDKSSTENARSKENKLPNRCVCNLKISNELSRQCSCGSYNNAMYQISKFKIPRKRTVSNDRIANKKAKHV